MDGRVAILIPAYVPGEGLPSLVGELAAEFGRVVVVDDGSPSKEIFRAIPDGAATVLSQDMNRGKGVALKTGLKWIAANLPDVSTVVTVDADGQHVPSDVRRVAAASLANQGNLVLGVRKFVGKVPFRSLWGNTWSRLEFLVFARRRIADVQTGLRGIPASLLGRFSKIPGDGYDYETRMLVDACRLPARIVQVEIETVYENGNASSHFRPLQDTLLTQKAFFAEVFR